MSETMQEHKVIEPILKALTILETEGDTSEDGRTKSIVKTKLQEALLWATHIYRPITMHLEEADTP